MKKFFYGMLIVAALVGGLFALFEDKIFTDIPEDVKANLELRYGTKSNFKFVDYIPEENTEHSRVMKIGSKYGTFKLTRYYNGDGVVHYNDNYLGYVYKDEIKETLDDVFSFPISEGRLVYEVDLDNSSFPDSTDNLVNYSQLLSQDETFIKIKVSSKFEWTDDLIKSVAEKLENNGGMKLTVNALESDELIDFSDFDSVMRSPESEGKRVFFSIGNNREVIYSNRE